MARALVLIQQNGYSPGSPQESTASQRGTNGVHAGTDLRGVQNPKDLAVFNGKEVLLKVITFVGVKKAARDVARLQLIGAISKASNSQTKVEESDRRANDVIQVKLQKEFFESYGLYYERKRGEFSDGIHYGYLQHDLIVNREQLLRVSLACEYRANQARSSVSKFFDESALASLLRVKDTGKYAYGYEVLSLSTRRSKRHRG